MRQRSVAVALTIVLLSWSHSLQAQDVGRDAAMRLQFDEIRFEPPVPEVHEVNGITVLFIEDRSVPLVSVFGSFQGGYANLPRTHYAAATALSALLRFGGMRSMAADSVDEVLEHHAIQTVFGSGGESVTASLNTLSEHLPLALELWGGLLKEPAFEADEIETWRGRSVEQIRRRPDNPQGLAYSEFNRLLYGDHPVGWEMSLDDLTEERLNERSLREVHARIVCREQTLLGVTGDVGWEELEGHLEALLEDWPACDGDLPAAPVPDIRREAGVFVIPRELEQTTVVMAHPTSVHLADAPEYFAAQIGNSILGGGGFSSRLLNRVRTQEGYAYSAASVWTMPRRYDGILGAITQTRPENTVPAIRLILETMGDLTLEAPSEEEVRTGVERVVNGFVFNFETPGRIVARQMYYLARDLTPDWLERYLRGVQGVTPASVHEVFSRHLRPGAMTILVVGDPARIGLESLEALGPVTILDVGERR